MKKYLLLLTIVAALLCPTTPTQAQKIKNTASFITYFTSIDNMVAYGKVKDSIEYWGKEIKNSIKLSDNAKKDLQVYYDNVQLKSQQLYDQLLADLTNGDKRKQIRSNVLGYVQSIDNKFKDINDAYVSFKEKYTSFSGAPKGAFLVFIVQQFLLPIAKAFINEVINDAIKVQMDNHLKPLIVVKDWNSL